MRNHQHEHYYQQAHSRPIMEVLSPIYCTTEDWTSKECQEDQESTRTNQIKEGKGICSEADGQRIQEGSKDERGKKYWGKKAKRELNRTECKQWLLGQGWIFGHLVEMY